MCSDVPDATVELVCTEPPTPSYPASHVSRILRPLRNPKHSSRRLGAKASEEARPRELPDVPRPTLRAFSTRQGRNPDLPFKGENKASEVCILREFSEVERILETTQLLNISTSQRLNNRLN